MMPTYDFKLLPELGWSIVVGVLVALGLELINVDASVFADPEAFLLAVATGSARAVGGAILSIFRPKANE